MVPWKLRLPVISAPMFLVSGARLVNAARHAGVIGAMPAGGFREHADFVRALAEVATSDNEGELPPYAINLSLNARRRLGDERYYADVSACAERRSPLIISTSGDPREIVGIVHGWGGLVFHDVTTVKHARKAVDAGVDGLILISAGGGGHSGRMSPLVFVSAVRRFFLGPIVLGGAVSSGEAILAAQALGADLCYVGTRFIATQEANAPDGYKQMLVDAGPDDLVYTGSFTRGVPANFLMASVTSHGLDAAVPTDLHAKGGPRLWRDLWSAGQSVALVDDIPPAASVVDRFEREYRAALSRLVGATKPYSST